MKCPFCQTANTKKTGACRVCGAPLQGLDKPPQQQPADSEPTVSKPAVRGRTAQPHGIKAPATPSSATPPAPRGNASTPATRRRPVAAPQLLARHVLPAAEGRIVGLDFLTQTTPKPAVLLVMNNGAIYQYGVQDDTLRQLARPSSKIGELCCTAFAAEADFIAAGFTDGSICLHNMEAGPDNGWQPVMVYRCKGHHGCVNALALSPDGQWLASGGTDGTILLWNAHSGERLHEVGQKASEITALAISPDGALLASGSDQGAVHIWDIHKSRLEWTRTGHHLWIKSLAFSCNGNALASGGYDGRVRLWATHSGHELHAVEHHRTSITSLMYAPDNRTLACGDTQGRINIYDSWTGTLHRWLPACKAAVEEIALAPTQDTGTGLMLACATSDEVSVWSIRLA